MQAAGLASFLSRMLVFHPHQRATAGELLSDPWLTGDLPPPPTDLVELSARKRADAAPPAGAEDAVARVSSSDPGLVRDATSAKTAVPPPGASENSSGRAAQNGASAAPVDTAATTAAARGPAPGPPVADDVSDAARRRGFSCPGFLSGGDDAARAGAARGYSSVFCADLSRYAITLADFEALEARDLADAEAELEGMSDEDGLAYLPVR